MVVVVLIEVVVYTLVVGNAGPHLAYARGPGLVTRFSKRICLLQYYGAKTCKINQIYSEISSDYECSDNPKHYLTGNRTTWQCWRAMKK